jgi:arylsulfatase A-like enzyme
MWYGYEAGRQGKFAQAVRQGKWKLIRWAPGSRRDGTVDVNPTGTTEVAALPVKVPKEMWHKELYDLDADPGETTNLSLMEPEVVAELLQIIETEHAEPPFEREPWRAKKEARGSR